MAGSLQGTIVKGIAGFYYVLAGEGESRTLYECKARGIFRLDGITPLAGDRVTISLQEDGTGSIDEILPRVNVFDRPPVANVETMVLVAASKEPEPNFPLLDRFCVMAEQKNCRIAVCVNKADIGDPAVLQRFRNVYGPVYPVFIVSTVTGEGFEELRAFLKGTQAALAGPSGVGKSSIANVLLDFEASETGEISRKTLRGKNTTRHTELFDAGEFRTGRSGRSAAAAFLPGICALSGKMPVRQLPASGRTRMRRRESGGGKTDQPEALRVLPGHDEDPAADGKGKILRRRPWPI